MRNLFICILMILPSHLYASICDRQDTIQDSIIESLEKEGIMKPIIFDDVLQEVGEFQFLSRLKKIPLLEMYMFYRCSRVTKTHIKQITSLNLTKKRLMEVLENDLQDFIYLKNLWLSDNFLQTVSPQVFSNLLNVEKVDLSHNLLKTLSSDTFHHCFNLEELDLSHNYLTTLSKGTFDRNTPVKRLILCDNPLVWSQDVYENFDSLQNIQELHIPGNVKDVPEEFRDLLTKLKNRVIFCDASK